MQEIIVYILIAGSVFYAVYHIAGIFFKKQNHCGGCSSCVVKEKLK
ncbi:MAG TPA: FeoB-associated Cys-rich membrane protein [Bacteroidales bacterium]|nr:FeoB-associated Cys-rich membrane protein [Bacteroidales bacterium]